MKPVTAAEAAAIERAIGALEARVGVEVVTAVVPRADAYPEIPWRAFALGAAVSALAALVVDAALPEWTSIAGRFAQALTILGCGALAAGTTYLWPGFARLFVSALRAKSEARQCAEALFLSRELFATPRRDAVLVLVSEFERRVVVLPDAFYRGRIAAAEWEAVVDRMTPLLRQGRAADAFTAGLSALEGLLAGKGIVADGQPNVLPDGVVRGNAP
jgi:putative membrane protein